MIYLNAVEPNEPNSLVNRKVNHQLTQIQIQINYYFLNKLTISNIPNLGVSWKARVISKLEHISNTLEKKKNYHSGFL